MKYKCFCCGHVTLDSRAGYDICPVCFWEDDAYLLIYEKEKIITSLYNKLDDIDEEMLMDIPSQANHGLTLREGRENYKRFGACEEEMVEYVRKPRKDE